MAKVLANSSASEATTKLYLNDKLADVRFIFKTDDEVEMVPMVPANKALLAALSPVFDTMFFGELKEGGDVEIVDADTDGFKEFLQFFYLDKVTLTLRNIETVARLADKYDVLNYVKTCSAFLESQLEWENMCWGYQWAIFLKDRALIELCEYIIIRMPKKIFATETFQRCERDTLKHILELDLTCVEVDVFKACLAWAR